MFFYFFDKANYYKKFKSIKMNYSCPFISINYCILFSFLFFNILQYNFDILFKNLNGFNFLFIS